jgi:hypothetical protein
LADFQPIFGLLDYFDMAMTLAPSDTTPIRVDGKELVGCTPYNCGVIVFRKGEVTERFFERWGYWQEQTLADPEATGNDQATFMRALLDVPCRICVIRDTWNARTTGHELFRGPVRVIHARHADVEAVARDVNVVSDLRVWIPKAEICLYDGMSMAHHFKYCIRMTWLLCRRSLRLLARRLAGRRSVP